MLRMSTSRYFSRIRLLGWLARCRYVLSDGSNTFIMATGSGVSTNRANSNTNSKTNERHNSKAVLVYIVVKVHNQTKSALPSPQSRTS